ncbi:MAG: hypothetical protein ACPH5G_19290 [Pseudooceanicola atlanticus]
MTFLKGWRTIAFNAFCVVLVPILNLPEVAAILPTGWQPFYALFIAIVNLQLRRVTTTPLGRKE